MNKVVVLGLRDERPEEHSVINTTSRSTSWSKGLSPFFVGNNMNLYGEYTAKNLENAWQFAKLYKKYADNEGNPTAEYYDWAVKGWSEDYAHRYPMGRGAVPLCSVWNGKKLGYIDARKQIYIPLYAREVVKTEAYKKLKEMYDKGTNIALLDFDGYNYLEYGYSFKEVVNNPRKKMGHAFVIAMLLEEAIIVKNGKLSYNIEKINRK